MPGYTHLQRAQPITFGHALMAYASMLLRDLQRFEDATARMDSQCPLGSGALAGTTYPLDRQFTAEKLGFAVPVPTVWTACPTAISASSWPMPSPSA